MLGRLAWRMLAVRVSRRASDQMKHRSGKDGKGPCKAVVSEGGVHVCNEVRNKARRPIAGGFAQQLPN